MSAFSDLHKFAQEIDTDFLEKLANQEITNYTMDITHDDLAIDVYYGLNRPLEKIMVTVVVNKPIP